jgi:hypothetical protein
MADNEAHYQVSDWLLGEMLFLELKDLEEVKVLLMIPFITNSG